MCKTIELRDQIALEAMKLALADSAFYDADHVAKTSYALADAMMAARQTEALADGWIQWNGGEMPVPEGTLVDVRHHDGEEFFGQFAGRGGAGVWTHDEPHVPGDIVAYRVVKA